MNRALMQFNLLALLILLSMLYQPFTPAKTLAPSVRLQKNIIQTKTPVVEYGQILDGVSATPTPIK